MNSGTSSRLFLFPLNVVLFPNALLPLHVFEERYKIMVNRCIEANENFGIVLIKSGFEVGGPAVPYDVGTEARIVKHETLSDGRIILVTEGMRKFRITKADYSQEYLSARVEWIPEEIEEQSLLVSYDIITEALELTRSYLTALNKLFPEVLKASLEDNDRVKLSYQIAEILHFPVEERQALLEMSSARERLEKESDYLQGLLRTNGWAFEER